MRKGIWASPWFRQIAIACIYGGATALLRQTNFTTWMFLTGTHFSVLLLTPYRYWPALIVGESCSLAYMSFECVELYGLPWALTNLIPAILYMAPIVYWARERGRIFLAKGNINMGVLLACALPIAGLLAAYDCATMSITRLPANYGPVNYTSLGAWYLLVGYVSILMVAPTALFVRQLVMERDHQVVLRKTGDSLLLFECACFALPVLALLVWIGLSFPQARQIAQVAMFLPVVWLALRHGWQGAALGGTSATIGMLLLVPDRHNPETLQAEAIIAFVISTMLLVGNRIGSLDRRAENERNELRSVLALAQRNVHIGEMQLRMAAQALGQIRTVVQASNSNILNRLRYLQPALESHGYQREALVAQDLLHRLADHLYPISSQERSLPVALREGAVAKSLDEAGVLYRCDVRGSLSRLSPTLHTVIYRLICEAIADGCSRKNVSDITVRVRCGVHRDRAWVVANIFLRAHPVRVTCIRWDELIPELSRIASGLGINAIQDRAAIYEGRARERNLASGTHVSFLLLDPKLPHEAA